MKKKNKRYGYQKTDFFVTDDEPLLDQVKEKEEEVLIGRASELHGVGSHYV